MRRCTHRCSPRLRCRPVRHGGGAALLLLLLAGALSAGAQGILYDNRKEVAIPEYATLRVGPFYSTAILNATAGYRYTTSSGEGTDYIYDGDRGRIKEDGSEIPMSVSMDFYNYVPISRYSSLNASFRIGYRYFPLGTEENDFFVTIPDELAQANLSWDYYLARNLRGVLYDRMTYEADYVDTRGLEDDNGGERYERFENRIGTSLSWDITEVSQLGGVLERLDLLVLDNEEEFGDQERVEYREGLFFNRDVRGLFVLGGRVDFIQRDYDDESRFDTTETEYQIYIRGADGVQGGIPLTDHTTLGLRAGVASGTTSGSRTVRDEDGAVIEDDQVDANDGDLSVFTFGADLTTQMSRYLSHTLTYARGLRYGFNSAFEEYDSWRYTLNYNRPGVGVRVFSGYTTVDPTGEEDESAYDEWTSGIAIRYPLLSFLDLDASYIYTKRTNAEDNPDEDAPAETQDDYYTRRARIGTNIGLTKKVTWETYVERYERLSDLNELEFTRDTFESRLRYTHRF